MQLIARDTRLAVAPSKPQLPVAVPRRRRRLAWLKPALLIGTAAIAMSGAGILVATAIHNGVSFDLGRVAGELTAGIGLRVDDIMVEGRDHTAPDALLQAIGIDRGAPILAFDAEAARQRLEQIPWIERAVVERRLPNLIYVRLTERKPLALWQHEGRFAVVDAKGAVILDGDVGPYSGLPVVIGDDAPKEAEALLLLLDTEPDLKARVAAAVRVGGRRWNLHMDNGIDVRLPEEDPAVAWSTLAQFARGNGLLERDVVAIDLRLPDRMVVQLGKESADKLRALADPKKKNG